MPEMVSREVWFLCRASHVGLVPVLCFKPSWGLSGGNIDGIEKWAPVGNPLTSHSLWLQSLPWENGDGAWSPVGHVCDSVLLGACRVFTSGRG